MVHATEEKGFENGFDLESDAKMALLSYSSLFRGTSFDLSETAD